jgi:cytochrome c556
MPRIRSTTAALAATLALAACSADFEDTHPQQVLSKRKALFKDFTRTLEPMGLVARERKAYDAAAFAASALELQRLSTLPWVYFSADGNYPPTRALPAVWSEPVAFQQAQANYQASVTRLVQAAQSGQADAVRPAVFDVQEACKACHDRFRKAGAGG